MTKSYIDLDKKLIWHPYTQEKLEQAPLLINKAEGSYLYTKDGRKIFDAISSWWVNLHGHCNPYIQTKIKEQMNHFEQILLNNQNDQGREQYLINYQFHNLQLKFYDSILTLIEMFDEEASSLTSLIFARP